MGLFDGMSGVLADVFGDVVTWTASGGAAVELQAVFRREPVEVAAAEGGTVLTHMPSLRVRVSDAPGIAAGDLVQSDIDPGVSYRVVNVWPTRSPAADRFVLCELEVVE